MSAFIFSKFNFYFYFCIRISTNFILFIMKFLKSLFILALLQASVLMSAQEVLPVWQGEAPTSNGLQGDEVCSDLGDVSNVTAATLTVYKASKPNGKAVLCMPGGGYSMVSMQNEGSNFARWFTDQGITFIVLKYRLPNGHIEVPLNDATKAMDVVLVHATEWSINPQKIGLIGFSAGGHLASWLATHYNKNKIRPAFQILFYPVISMSDELTHKDSRRCLLGETPKEETIDNLSNEKWITPDTPPAFIVACEDDAVVNPENSITYYTALTDKDVEAELHVYPKGGHGWGFQDTSFRSAWQKDLANWLEKF